MLLSTCNEVEPTNKDAMKFARQHRNSVCVNKAVSFKKGVSLSLGSKELLGKKVSLFFYSLQRRRFFFFVSGGLECPDPVPR